MKTKTIDSKYNNIVEDILNNQHFKELDKLSHHGTSRLDHSKRVSFCSYKICKKLNLDYISAARAGLLHDFFTDTYTNSSKYTLIKNHPSKAIANSEKYFNLSVKEKNIIESHMFPLNINKKPLYPESFIVSFIDKISYIYEKFAGNKIR